MKKSEATTILEIVSQFQNKAEHIKRYDGNPYVDGDSVAGHLSRLIRLFSYISSYIQKEFPLEDGLVEQIFVILLIHDDDEILEGFDIPTANKIHNSNDEAEIHTFEKAIALLPEESKTNISEAFRTFRKKDSLAAKIAKALDNIAGNQLVVEQRLGLINPDQAKFAIEYVEKVKGVSKIIDMLIDAQITQIIEIRQQLLSNSHEVSDLLDSVAKTQKAKSDIFEKAIRLLKIDILSHTLDKTNINLPLDLL